MVDNSKKTVYQSKFFRVTQVEVEHNGKTFTKDIIERRNVVFVLPVTESNEIYLVSQYRDALQKVSLEVVAGQMDDGEVPLEAAKRELREETGLQASQWKLLATWYQSANLIGKISIFMATGLQEGEAMPDDDEELQTVKIPLEEAVKKVLDGEIDVSSNIAALLLLDKVKKAESR